MSNDVSPDRDQFGPGSRIGPWRVLGELGRGGMGVVYLAERADGQYERQVALKVIKRGMDTHEILRRFLTERRILARLGHPHIAALYDGGATDDGLPYFAMELVEGAPITSYCDDRRMSVEERLALFERACEAVRYAQLNLVLHRDIKPSNIMVTTAGRVKLLDFGLAKVLDPGESTEASHTTRTGRRWFTPAYAAPEQIAGVPATTATDVYGLGAVLYELLCGHLPTPLPSSQQSTVSMPADGEASPAARDQEPPSAALRHVRESPRLDGTMEVLSPQSVALARGTQPAQLRRRLKGDLDTLVVKAIAHDPAMRYPSAEALLDDLGRLRAGLPLAARPPSAAYRARKFVRRHRAGVVAAGIALLALLLGLGAATAGLLRARAAERRALEEAASSRQVIAFLESAFKISSPEEARGRAVTAREVLDNGAARIETELADQPRVRATLMYTLAGVYRNLGLYDQAVALIEKTIALNQRLLGDEHIETLRARASLSKTYYLMGRTVDAVTHGGAVVDTATRVLGTDHPLTMDAAETLASALWQTGRAAEAEPLFRRVFEWRHAHDGADAMSTQGALANLGGILADQGKSAEAEVLLRKAIDGLDASSGEDHPETVAVRNILVGILLQQGRLEEALALARDNLAIQRHVLGAHHPDTLMSVNNIGGIAGALGRAAEVETLLQQGLRDSEQFLPADHGVTVYLRFSYGQCLCFLERYPEGEPLMLRALSELRVSRPDDPAIPSMEADLAAMYLAWGKPDEAAKYTPGGS